MIHFLNFFYSSWSIKLISISKIVKRHIIRSIICISNLSLFSTRAEIIRLVLLSSQFRKDAFLYNNFEFFTEVNCKRMKVFLNCLEQCHSAYKMVNSAIFNNFFYLLHALIQSVFVVFRIRYSQSLSINFIERFIFYTSWQVTLISISNIVKRRIKTICLLIICSYIFIFVPIF